MVAALTSQNGPKRRKSVVLSQKDIELIDEATIRREMKWYEEKKEEYLQKYEGKYIALLNGELLDSDASISEMAKRVYEKHGYIAVFMTLVTRRSKPYRIASPRFKRVKIA